jgi:hypothetical protein
MNKPYYPETEIGINPKVFGFAILFVIIFIIAIGLPMTFPKPVIKQNVTPNITYVYKTVTVLVTPTPDGHIYYSGEYQNGTRLLKRPFTWIRYNALGKQDMKVTTIVYDYAYFEKLHWFNPTTYKYQELTPNGINKTFLLVCINTFMDDKGGDDTRMYAMPRKAFAVFDGMNTTYNIEYPYQWRFREVENMHNFNNLQLEAFKSFRAYSSSSDNSATAGEYNDENYYLRGGESNSIDGFLIFEVDKDSKPEDTKVLAQFRVFGYSSWRLSV